MQITPAIAANRIQPGPLYQLPTIESTETGTSEKADQVSLSAPGRTAEGKWLTIAGKYDVTNISTRERGAMGSELAENGLISSLEGMALMAPLSMDDDLDTKVNFLEISRESLEVAKSNGASAKQVELQESVVKILEELHGLASSAD